MIEKLAACAFIASVAILWAGHMISSAVRAASNIHQKESARIIKSLNEIESQLRWINDSVKRVENRLPKPPNDFS